MWKWPNPDGIFISLANVKDSRQLMLVSQPNLVLKPHCLQKAMLLFAGIMVVKARSSNSYCIARYKIVQFSAVFQFCQVYSCGMDTNSTINEIPFRGLKIADCFV